MTDEPRKRPAAEMPTLYEITDGGRTCAVIYDAMTVGQTGVRADGSKFTMLGFRVLAVRAGFYA